MERYDPERMERSTRDLVARACFTEVLEGRGRRTAACGSTSRTWAPPSWRRAFAGMVKRCRDFGFDLAREPVEVGPTAHFMMGGVVDRPVVPHRRSRGCSPRARTPAACTGPIGSAATAWRSRRCSAGSRATPWRSGSPGARSRACRARAVDAVDAPDHRAAARAQRESENVYALPPSCARSCGSRSG